MAVNPFKTHLDFTFGRASSSSYGLCRGVHVQNHITATRSLDICCCMLLLRPCRYMDEVRKVVKACYEDVWTILQEHREALWAGIAALSEAKEMLGGELRDVFDAHPPKPIADDVPAAALDGMHIWTPEGRAEPWPYGVEWFRDTYPKPHWVAVREQHERRQQQEATSGGSSSSS